MKPFAILAAVLISNCSIPILAKQPEAPRRLNVIIIVADDLGYSDLGAFGGEIRTPNLDALAKAGLRLTNFHAAPTCSPTRSMLLSGTDNHTAGVGAMAEMRTISGNSSDVVPWGYEGVLTRRVATLAERLHAGGYYTMLSGKWHLGLSQNEIPAARGFDSSFALLQGGVNHFGGGFGPESNPDLRATFMQDRTQVGVPSDFYSSDYFTSALLTQMDKRPSDKPFFAYLSFTAPHSPLQAPLEDMARYKGRYDAGWAVLREKRVRRMKELGILSQGTVPADIKGYAEAWNSLTADQKKIEARKMEILAAMVDRMDQNVGRLVDYLKRTGQFDNTVILFTSDNGPAAEGAETFGRLPGMAKFIASRDDRFEAMGSKGSMVFLGPNWAQAASAPYRLFKGMITEGGTRVAAFITYPGAARNQSIGAAYADVMDVVPTIMDAASRPIEPRVDGREVAPVRGRSLVPYLHGVADSVHPLDEPIAYELHGHRAVSQGDWKLIFLPTPAGPGSWALYDLSSDPAEQYDRSADHPERKRALLDAWQVFATQAKIMP